MTPERLRQIEQLYHSTLARPDGERAAFLSEACGADESLRLEVESLIAEREHLSDFLETPAFERGLQLLAEQHGSFVGRRIGRYEVLSLIGEGGMGEVYLARDTSLKRNVAIKSLQPSETASPEMNRRFWQEALAASAIAHRNVAQIYEVLEDPRHYFIVMEYVDGMTLRESLRAGPLPLLDGLLTTCQIAAALVAAHGAGVAHRDIKPENVMLLADGFVKVLDFGLAKRITPAAADDGEDLSRSSSFFMTAPGILLGTMPYMSPEQARGLGVDARTDLWSLGVVAYEMVAGRTPFGGETPSDIIAAILERRPRPLTDFSPDAPGKLQRIIDKALAKEREQRYQTASEMYDDLKALHEELSFETKRRAGASKPAEESRPVEESRPIGTSANHLVVRDEVNREHGLVHGTSRRLLAATSLAVLLGALVVWWAFSARSEHFMPGRFEMRNFSESGNVLEAAISPDGKFVVFVTDEDVRQRLWLKQMTTPDKMALPQPQEGAYNGITVSSDSNYIYYSLFGDTPRGELYRVSIPAGTDARKLLDDVDPPVSLSPDGTRLAFVRQNHTVANELIIADANNGRPTPLVSDSRLLPGGVTWSPRGDIIACSVRVAVAGQSFVSIGGFKVGNGQPVDLTSNRWRRIDRVVWLADMSGLVLVASDERSRLAQLWHVSYPGGEARRITTDIGEYRTLSVTADSSVIASVQSMRSSRIWTSGLVGASPAPAVLSAGRDEGFNGVAWAPDGRIVYTSTASGSGDLWIIERDGSNPRRLTSDGRSDRHPIVTPDGRHVVYVSDHDGLTRLWRVNLDGSGLTPLTGGPDDSFPSVSPDGRWVVYASRTQDRRSLWRVPVEGGQPQRLTQYLSHWPAVSPDGKHIACLYRDDPATSPLKLAVIPFEGGVPARTFDLPPGIARPPDMVSPGFRWNQDSLSVLYVNTADGAANIWSQPISGGPARQVTDFTADRVFWFDISRADNSLVYARGQYTHDVVLLSDQTNR
jgi:serine/threonine protein kinase